MRVKNSNKYPHFPENCHSLLKKYLTPEVFDKLVTVKSRSGFSLTRMIRSGVENPEGQSIGARSVDCIGADDLSGAWNIAYKDARAGKVFSHIAGKQPPVKIITAAGIGGDDISDGPAIEEVRFRFGGVSLSAPGKRQQSNEKSQMQI